MKVIELHSSFGLDQLTLAEHPEPTPGRLDVIVKMRAAALHYRDPRAGRHQLRWLTEVGFTRIEMSASYDCWTSTPEAKSVSARFLESLVSDSAFARQLVAAGLANQSQLESMQRAFAAWGKDSVAFAAEAWTEAVAWKP